MLKPLFCALPHAILVLPGCTAGLDAASIGAPGPLKDGSYEISRRYGDEAEVAVDVLEVGKEEPSTFVKHYVNSLWLKMEPNLPGPSQLDSQVNCHHGDPIVSADGTFTNDGFCNVTGTNQDTRYTMKGRVASEGFEVINRSGANVPAGEEVAVFTGRLKSRQHGFL